MRERRDVANGWWGDGAIGSGGRATVVGVVAIVFSGVLDIGGGVDVVDCRAGGVAWKTTKGVVAAFTAGFELLATQAAGQQVR